ncbi:MAG: carnitine dehydratase [Halioglobus sp.]|nr:carnitine dehydratase [Halioglobus sp.]
MTDVMQGVRILEVAEHMFVPAAGAILSDWGADVIKVEHHERGDAMRGLGSTGVLDLSQGVHVLNEHANRGKRSIGLDLASEEGVAVLYELAKTCDVFLSNKLPGVLQKLKIDVEDIRAHNPDIIYVRGTASGPRGPDGNRGGYDMTSFWCRSGCAQSVSPPGLGYVLPQPGPGFGDSIGGMTIAGGIAAALFKRERSGETSVVDVSLLAAGVWSVGPAIALSAQSGQPWALGAGAATGSKNPLTGLYQTSDGRFISLVMLQGFRYWPDFCRHIGREELIDDARFDSHEKLSENAAAAADIIREEIAGHTLAEWTRRFQTLLGQWAPVQNTVEVAADAQVRANGYITRAATRKGAEFELVATPVQFDGEPSTTARAPDFNEHCEDILAEAGIDGERMIELKIAGVVA